MRGVVPGMLATFNRTLTTYVCTSTKTGTTYCCRGRAAVRIIAHHDLVFRRAALARAPPPNDVIQIRQDQLETKSITSTPTMTFIVPTQIKSDQLSSRATVVAVDQLLTKSGQLSNLKYAAVVCRSINANQTRPNQRRCINSYLR